MYKQQISKTYSNQRIHESPTLQWWYLDFSIPFPRFSCCLNGHGMPCWCLEGWIGSCAITACAFAPVHV